ncbi:hypothetical protein OH77DRAFT_69593 [Trametes cingulata]|nr:hypothetical protein OH77DRAFT_69593 [Trametes cingulata]
MEKLAVELLLNIFALSCTDGGYTACSLALVCKHVGEVSRPLRFYSVALNGCPRKMQSFLIHLGKEHSAACLTPQAKVRHLYLTTVDPTTWRSRQRETTPALVEGGVADSREDDNVDNADTRHSELPLTIEQYSALVASLLSSVAPDLETFTFLPYPYGPPSALTGIAFPHLRELRLVKPSSSTYDIIGKPTGPPLYPSLKKLLLNPGDLDAELWAYLAPGVTHLRVSGVGYQTSVGALAAVHGTGGSPGPFSELQSISIQLDPPPPSRYCHGRPSVTYKRMVPALWKSQGAAASIPVYILPPEVPWNWEERQTKFYQQWLEWMEGRLDIWQVSEKCARGAYQGDTLPPYLCPPSAT